MKQLTELQRKVLLGYASGEKVSDLASSLGVSDKKLRKIRDTAMAKLRHALEEKPKPSYYSAEHRPAKQPAQAQPASSQLEDDTHGAFATPRNDVEPLVEVYFAGDNLSAKEIRLFLNYLAARYREIGGSGLTVVEGQTLVPETVEAVV